ncbi:acyltransferase family protein [Pseudomonas poae]|uniref:Acyltransferase family protein n=2 Tax=Pseudomonas poae TaxID=200451 RepID=A0AAP2S4D0_9PSED|nr:acyltransferase family protein [Pseudomonas poae]
MAAIAIPLYTAGLRKAGPGTIPVWIPQDENSEMIAQNKSQYISIQMVRGIAALLVVLFHSHIAIDMMPAGYKVDIPFVYTRGHWAIYLFFVVSGFIITHVTSGEKFKLFPFLGKRIIRIYPIWWLSFVFALIGVYVFNVSFSYGTPLDTASYINSLLLLPSTIKPINSVGWTLIFEMLFYFVSALVLIRYSHRMLMLTLLLLFGIGAVLYSISPNHPWLINAVGHHFFSPFQLLFAAGIALYLYQQKLAWIHPAAGFALSVATVAGIINAPSATLGSGELYFIVLGVALASSLLIVALLNAERRGWLHSTNKGIAIPVSMLNSAGNCSFSLYLFHWGIFTIVGSKATQAYLQLPAWTAELWRFGWIAISIAVAMFMYRFFEAPISRHGGRVIRRLSAPQGPALPADPREWTTQHKVALVIEILSQKITIKQACETFNLELKQVEQWLGAAQKGMEGAFQPIPLD